MANATFVDAFKGYEYYLDQRGKASLDEINIFLKSRRRNPIRQRTYEHYRKLLRNGFRSYISINKFDVFQSLGKIQMAADRRRFKREPSENQVQISKNGVKWVDGRLVDRSLVGFGIVTEGRFPSRSGTPLWVRMEGYSDIPGILVWRTHNEDNTRIGIRSIEFIAKFRIQPESDSLREQGLLTITRDKEGDLDWEIFFNILDTTNQLMGSLADFLFAIGDASGQELHITRTVLDTIEFGSPGKANVNLDGNLAEIAKLIITFLVDKKLIKRRITAEVENTELQNLEIAARTEGLRLSNENMKIEVMRNALNLRAQVEETSVTNPIAEELKQQLPGILGLVKPLDDLLSPGSPERAILDERIIPAMLELLAGDDPDFSAEVSTKEENGDEDS